MAGFISECRPASNRNGGRDQIGIPGRIESEFAVGGDPAQYAKYYRSVERVGELDSPYASRSETGIPVDVLRGLRIPLATAWPSLKHYD